jgi:hypothetical protein
MKKTILLTGMLAAFMFAFSAHDAKATSIPSCGNQNMYWDGTQCVGTRYCTMQYPNNCDSNPCAPGYTHVAGQTYCYQPNPNPTSICSQFGTYWDGVSCKQFMYCTMQYPSTCTANPCAPGYARVNQSQNDCTQQTPQVPPYYQSHICQANNTYWNGTNCVSIRYCSAQSQCDSYQCVSGYIHGTTNIDCVYQNPNPWSPYNPYTPPTPYTPPYTPHAPCMYPMWSACGQGFYTQPVQPPYTYPNYFQQNNTYPSTSWYPSNQGQYPYYN